MIALTIVQRLLEASIETAVAALIVAAVSLVIGRRSPRLVALLWLVVMIKPLLTLAGATLLPVELPPLASVMHRRNVAVNVVRVISPAGAVQREERTTRRDPIEWLAALWLAGVTAMLVRTIVHRLRLRAIVRASHEPSSRLAAVYRGLASQHAPRLCVSDTLDGPAIAGAFQPAILIPSWMESQADDAQLEWTLRHELRHASARDTVAIALRELALIVFWFHPAIWIAAHLWEGATELACDRDVVRDDAEAVGYADALLRTLMHVRQQRRLQLASGLFATRSKIGARISALIERPLAPKAGRLASACALVIAVALIGVGSTFASQRGHSHGDLEEVDDNRSFSLHYDGTISTSPLSISERGFVWFRETSGGTTRDLRLDGTKSGVARTYRVNGKVQPLDDSFERHAIEELERVRGGHL